MSWTTEFCEEIWSLGDKDGSGYLDIHELDNAIKQALGEKGQKVEPKQIAMIFASLDKSGDKKVSRDEFFEEMTQKTERVKGMKKMFKEFDTDGSDSLTKDEVRKLVEASFDAKCVDKVFDTMMEVSDASGDGKLSYDEFLSFFE